MMYTTVCQKLYIFEYRRKAKKKYKINIFNKYLKMNPTGKIK